MAPATSKRGSRIPQHSSGIGIPASTPVRYTSDHGLVRYSAQLWLFLGINSQPTIHCKKSVLEIQEYIHEGANLKFYIPEFFNFKLLIPEYSPI
jgi:hypothetical protein